MGKLNHLKTIQKMPEQHSWKALHLGSTYNSHSEQCAHNSESRPTNVEVQEVCLVGKLSCFRNSDIFLTVGIGSYCCT
jgi:hypothetical protein